MLTSYNQHFLSLFGEDCRNIDDSSLTKKIMRNHFVTITGMIAGDALNVAVKFEVPSVYTTVQGAVPVRSMDKLVLCP